MLPVTDALYDLGKHCSGIESLSVTFRVYLNRFWCETTFEATTVLIPFRRSATSRREQGCPAMSAAGSSSTYLVYRAAFASLSSSSAGASLIRLNTCGLTAHLCCCYNKRTAVLKLCNS